MEEVSKDNFCCIKFGCEGNGKWKLERDIIGIGILWSEEVEDKG